MGDSSGGENDTNNIQMDFSIDGAQSLSLQNFLKTNKPPFVCDPCSRNFLTLLGLQIHQGHHKKLTDKITVRKSERQRKQYQENSFLLDESDELHMPLNDLDEFLNMHKANLATELANEKIISQSSECLGNESQSKNICSICKFVAKSKAGLKSHMRKHTSENLLIEENSVTLNDNEDKIRVRVPCPFSPSRTFVDNKRLQTHLEKKHCDEILHLNSLEGTTPSILVEKLMFYRNKVPTLRRIPKGARFSAADKFAKIINECIEKNSIYAWEQLLTFSYISFNIKGNKDKSLTSKIKENIKNFSDDISIPPKKTQFSLSKRIEAKVTDFDIKGAIRILSSDDKLAPFNEETLSKLKSKHPAASSITQLENPPPPSSCSLIVNEQQVRKKINSFQYGSGPGIDGLRPQFLKDIISKTAGEAGDRALKSITRFANFILAGEVRDDMKPIFFGASLCALCKKDNGIRPIAVGNAIRRLCGKLACSCVQEDAHNYLNPKQVGVATPMGGESIVHAIRKYAHDPSNRNKVILKIDFQNAFNSIDRSKMLTRIAKYFPKIYQLLSSSYSTPSLLFFGKNTISSEVGCQQGDPCGPLSFSVTIQPIVENIKSELNSWYLDDGSLADYYEVVLEDFRMIIKEAEELGLKINPDKCELFFISGVKDDTIVNEFEKIDLVSLILPNMDKEVTLHFWHEALEHWNSINNDKIPEHPSIQKNWDSINLERIIVEELNFENIKDIARFKALQEPESGGWLQVIPSTNIGTAMNNQDFQICVALRLGMNYYRKHKCICGSLVDESGTHGLCCSKAKGTYPRHVDLNRIFHRALTSARCSSTLEPLGLSRDDGKRPDGMTLAPWSNGKRLVWDVTCVDTLAPSYLNITSKTAGSAAELACNRKHTHYTKIKESNFIFVGLAFETLGPWCKESKSFVDSIGKLLIEESGDIRARKFLYNRISLAIQKGNAASVLGTHPIENNFYEIYNL